MSFNSSRQVYKIKSEIYKDGGAGRENVLCRAIVVHAEDTTDVILTSLTSVTLTHTMEWEALSKGRHEVREIAYEQDVHTCKAGNHPKK